MENFDLAKYLTNGVENHIGGCVLFEQKDKVEAIIERSKQNE